MPLTVSSQTRKNCQAGLPDKNFDKSPNSATKRREKGQAVYLEATKKPKFVVLLFFFHEKTPKLQEYH